MELSNEAHQALILLAARRCKNTNGGFWGQFIPLTGDWNCMACGVIIKKDQQKQIIDYGNEIIVWDFIGEHGLECLKQHGLLIFL